MEGLILLLLLAAMWAALIVPQQRRMRRQRELIATVQVGDDVMTASGLYGTITGEDDDDIFLEIAPGVEVRMSRASVASKVEYEDDAPVAEEPDTDAT